MDKITAVSIADSKPNFVVAVEAAATLTLAAGEIGIFVGTNVKDVNNQRVVTALDELRDLLRENQYPTGVNGLNLATGTPPGKTSYVITDVAAIPALTENEVVIGYGNSFYPDGNSTNFGAMLRSMIEYFQEQILKFN